MKLTLENRRNWLLDKARERAMIKHKQRKPRSDKGSKRVYVRSIPSKFRQFIARANARQLTWELSLDEFTQLLDSQCTYCGSQSTSIDRVDSSLGYTIDNCAPCCGKCNLMKYTHSVHDFLSHINKIYQHNHYTHAP